MISTINCNEAKKIAKTVLDITNKKSKWAEAPLTISNVKSVNSKKVVAFLDRAKEGGNEEYSSCLNDCLVESDNS